MAVAAASAIAQPVTLFTVPAEHRLIEGVAMDGRTVWVSSVLDRQILKCRKTCTVVATLPKGMHPMGMAWDRLLQRLWIATDCPDLPGVEKCEHGWLAGLNARGKLVVRMAPEGGTFHVGDVSASRAGVFVSDSQNGAVYRLNSRGTVLRETVPIGVGKSAQGSVTDPTGKTLIVADYSQGIAAIDLATGVRTILKQANDHPVRGVDGLTRCGGVFYGIYNGGALPPALVRFSVSGDRITLDRPIEGSPLADPTQLAVDGEMMVLVGKAGWEEATKGAARTDPTSILAYDPPESCEISP